MRCSIKFGMLTILITLNLLLEPNGSFSVPNRAICYSQTLKNCRSRIFSIKIYLEEKDSLVVLEGFGFRLIDFSSSMLRHHSARDMVSTHACHAEFSFGMILNLMMN